ncbi:hypothetical protein V8E54_005664 [Elaphomyces granulatus]
MPLKSNERRREKEHEVRDSSFNNRYNNITKSMTRTKGIYLFEVCRIHPTIDSFGVPSVPPLHGIFGGKFEYKRHWVAGLAVENDVNEEAFAKHWTASIVGTTKGLGATKSSNAFYITIYRHRIQARRHHRGASTPAL